MSPRARRTALAGAMLTLFAVALTVFVLPFAFPTPPPIVTRFSSTLLFSPNGDGRREVAQVSVRLRVEGRVSLELQRDGETVRRLMAGARHDAGLVGVEWDGRDGAGRRVPDGTYALKLRARSGKRQFNTTRKVIVDTRPPALARYTVRSAALAGPGAGECRVAATPADDGTLTLEAFGPRGGRVQALGPRPARAGRTERWPWRALTRGGAEVPPGLYRLTATLADAARNRVVETRTCWVGRLIGRALPPVPPPGGAVGVALRRPDGTPLPAATPVRLALYERAGTPGRRVGPVLGARVAEEVEGTAGEARITLPPGAAPTDLWLVAGAGDGRALVPMGRAR